MGRGTVGIEPLRGELEAENEGVKIPFAVRWQGRPSDARAFKEGRIAAPSVTFAIVGEERRPSTASTRADCGS